MLAALELVDAGGLKGLSMRKVAASLDVEAMSLYRHVRNKADLLDGLHDHLISLVPSQAEGDWQQQVVGLARGFRGVLFAHPHCVPLLASRPATTPAALAVVEAGIRVLVDEGWSEEQAVIAFQTVFVFVVGHAVFHTAGGELGDDAWAKAEFEGGLAILLAGLQQG